MKRVALMVVGLTMACVASAISWQGTSGGNWNDPTKWAKGQIPSAGDTAYFGDYDLDSCKIVLTNDVTVGKLQFRMDLPYPASAKINGTQCDLFPFCLYGPAHSLTVDSVVWDNFKAGASKSIYFDLKELRLGSAPVVPKGSQDLVFLNGIVLTAAGDLLYQGYGSLASGMEYSLLHFGGETVFNAADGHDIVFDHVSPYGDMSLKTRGTGVVSLKFDDSAMRLAATTLEEDSTLVMRGRLNTDTLTLEAGSTLILTAGVAHVELGTSLAKADAAAIRVEVPSDLADGIYSVFTGAPGNDFVEGYKSLVTLAGDGATDAVLLAVNGSVALLKGDLPSQTPGANEYVWQGTEKTGQWTTSANWLKTSGDYPKNGQAIAYLRGIETATITNDNSSSLHHVKFTDACGPMTLAGSAKMTLFTYGNDGLTSYSRFPAVCKPNVYQDNTGLHLKAFGGSYLEVGGEGSGTTGLSLCGDVRFGGRFTATMGWRNNDKDAFISVLSGGRLTATSQESGNWLNTQITVEEDGELYECNESIGRGSIPDVNWTCDTTFRRHYRIDGLYVLSGRLACGTMHYYGTGRLEVERTSASAAYGNCCIGGGLTLIPGVWYTVSDNDTQSSLGIMADGPATLGAKGDWRYGVDPTLTNILSKAANRALRVCEWATLTVDTANPDTGVGQMITLADPIFAYGKLVKKGAGTLQLATTNNVFGDTVTLQGGDIAWTTNNAPTFAALACAGGALAPAIDEDGACVPAVVASDTDVSLLRVSFAKGAVPGDWTTVLKATGGAALSGLPKQHNLFFRLVEGAEGDELQVHRTGTVIIVR